MVDLTTLKLRVDMERVFRQCAANDLYYAQELQARINEFQEREREKEMKKDFNSLLKEGVSIANKIEALEKKRKLTAKSFLREAMAIADTTRDKLTALEAQLEKPLMERSRLFYRNALRWLKEPTCSCPTKNPRRLTWLCLGHEGELNAELATINTSIFELFALAVRTAVHKWPERFGTIEDMEKHQNELHEAQAVREKIYKQIEEGYSREDLAIGPTDSQGQARITFAVSGGEVPLGEHAGERLLNWLRVHPEVVKKL